MDRVLVWLLGSRSTDPMIRYSRVVLVLISLAATVLTLGKGNVGRFIFISILILGFFVAIWGIGEVIKSKNRRLAAFARAVAIVLTSAISLMFVCVVTYFSFGVPEGIGRILGESPRTSKTYSLISISSGAAINVTIVIKPQDSLEDLLERIEKENQGVGGTFIRQRRLYSEKLGRFVVDDDLRHQVDLGARLFLTTIQDLHEFQRYSAEKKRSPSASSASLPAESESVAAISDSSVSISSNKRFIDPDDSGGGSNSLQVGIGNGNSDEASPMTVNPIEIAEPQPLRALYMVARGDKVIGEAKVRLGQAGNGEWRLTTETKGTAGIALLLGLDVNESSLFRWIDGVVECSKYDYEQNAAIKKKNRHIEFDWLAGVAHVNYGEETHDYPIQPGTIDRHMVSLVVGSAIASGRKKVGLAVAMKDHVEHRHYQESGKEALTVPLGTFEATRVERIGSPDELRFWYAPERSLLPVKIEQLQGDNSIVLSLKGLSGR